MKDILTNVTYRNLDTGNVAYKNGNEWYDSKTNKRIWAYRVYRYVSLSSKLKI
ncbi:MAG: hypothetical protein Tp133SUR523431_3 [Prokaryotic dsDNA virus sp.]|nr:MAG: hypothetical protein Tp133SUR523431_3 [Prokaryotic dsDNA virus sp.]|tara:strand:+ start:384 stop:542 length:159 start_codon:yes stop_codon:yes gene_type:complete